MRKKKPVEVFEITEVPVIEDDMERLNNKHYEKQMEMVRYILNLKRKGFDVKDATTKSQLAYSYVEMIYNKSEEYMDKYWRELHNVKKEYVGVEK